MYQEINSTFIHDNAEYDLNRLFALTRGRQPVRISVRELIWVLDYSTPEEWRVSTADITVPIMVFEDVVLDGLHRLTKAIRENVMILPCIKVTIADLNDCRL